MELILDIISWAFLISGSFLCLTGVVGLLRFPDFFSRIHASCLTDTMGAGLILSGLMIQAGWGLVLPKLIMILLFSLPASHSSSCFVFFIFFLGVFVFFCGPSSHFMSHHRLYARFN